MSGARVQASYYFPGGGSIHFHCRIANDYPDALNEAKKTVLDMLDDALNELAEDDVVE